MKPVRAGLAASATHSGRQPFRAEHSFMLLPYLALASLPFALLGHTFRFTGTGHACSCWGEGGGGGRCLYFSGRHQRHRAEAHPDQLAIPGEKMLLPSLTALQQPRVALFPDICSPVVEKSQLISVSVLVQLCPGSYSFIGEVVSRVLGWCTGHRSPAICRDPIYLMCTYLIGYRKQVPNIVQCQRSY